MKTPFIQDSTILTIDDNPTNLDVLRDYLTHAGAKVLIKKDGESGFETAVRKQPDIILLDIIMPGMDGYETCRHLKSNQETLNIPVIFTTALSETVDKIKGFKLGAVDYITKPFQVEEVLARVESCLKTHQLLRRVKQTTVEQLERYQLSEREIKVLRLYASGHSRHAIGLQLFISENTVKWHLKNIFIKINVENRCQAIEKARDMGILANEKS